MPDRDHVLSALRELVEALDRREAHLEHLGESRIVREALALRQEAMTRIHELTAARGDCDAREAELSASVMADDGGPVANNLEPIELIEARVRER